MSDSSPELLKKKHYQSLALSLENTLHSIQQSFMPQVDADSVKFGSNQIRPIPEKSLIEKLKVQCTQKLGHRQPSPKPKKTEVDIYLEKYLTQPSFVPKSEVKTDPSKEKLIK